MKNPLDSLWGTVISGLRTTMKNPLDSLWGTVICGLILTLILHNIVSYALGG